ncbi:MAG: hypothetical protein PUE58_01820 [Lachnospiraceae bacterium]|nr:hypothetical protein [Lachnospiraceae bacterium]
MDIDVEIYDDLKEKEAKYEYLLGLMMRTAELSYSLEFLQFNSEKISALLEAMEPEMYQKKLSVLKETMQLKKEGRDEQ